jgi:aspartate aminotransferase
MEPSQLKAIAEVLKDYPQVTVITDEIYAQLVYDGFHQDSFVKVAPELKERTVVVNGMSKVYAMTGWRVGFAAGPQALIKPLNKIQGQTTSNASSIAQRAALGALKGDQGIVSEMVCEFTRRRNRMMELLRAIPKVTCLKPRGAFYCFPNISAYFGKKTPSGTTVNDSVELASFLLEEMGVALVPGIPFGAPNYMRLSFATSMEQIEAGISRMREGLGKLR